MDIRVSDTPVSDTPTSDMPVSVGPPVSVRKPAQLSDTHNETLVERADERQGPAEQPEPAGDAQ